MAKIIYDQTNLEFPKLQMKARLKFRTYNKLNPKKEERLIKFLKGFLGSFGKESYIAQPFYCDMGSNIFIGDNTFINYNCVMLDMAKISIGNHVMIGPNVTISPASHSKVASERFFKSGYAEEITIEDNVWIGANVSILPGITIKKGAVIGAGSVITKDVEEFSVVAGVPAKEISKTKF